MCEKVTSDMLTEAMKKAVELEIFPKYAGEDSYLKHWDNMKQVLKAALRVQ